MNKKRKRISGGQAAVQSLKKEKVKHVFGLIGSATKKARFVRRLRQAGVTPQMMERLVCPIGIAEISDKAPNMVALSIAAQLAIWQQIKGNRWPGSSESIDIAGVRDD